MNTQQDKTTRTKAAVRSIKQALIILISTKKQEVALISVTKAKLQVISWLQMKQILNRV